MKAWGKAWAWLTTDGEGKDMPRWVFVVQVLWTLGLLALFLDYIHGSDRLDLPHSFGKVPVEAPWLGAMGGLLASLGGIARYSRGEWKSNFNFWHPVKPLTGAASGAVACLLIIVLVRTATGNSKLMLDATALDAAAFVFGFAEASFRELIKAVTDVFLKPGGSPKEEGEGKEGEGKASPADNGPTGDGTGTVVNTGTWQALQSQPKFPASTMLLLTDGTVMVAVDPPGDPSNSWWRLTPDAAGSYVAGTWSRLAPMDNARRYFASAVLKDGRVIVAGGEDSDAGPDLDRVEIYDPTANTWTKLAETPGWGHIGDAPACLLSDGRWLVGDITSQKTAIFDPATENWSETGEKASRSSEETWTLLPDGTVLAVQTMERGKAEKYLPAAGEWVPAGATPAELVQASSSEIGPAILLPDGDLFCIGATGFTALYTPPPMPGEQGTWAAGPDFPRDAQGRLLKAKDAPAALLPSGNVLCVAGQAGDAAAEWPTPSEFFEYDTKAKALARTNTPASANTVTYAGHLLVLPNGQVLYSFGQEALYVYTATGAPQASFKPTITEVPPELTSGNVGYVLIGTQLNGLSQAASYGDDAQMATNYPLVTLRPAGGNEIHYCRTHDHSSMGVATGAAPITTHFDVPAGLTTGPYELTVIANGIASDPVPVNVG